MNVGIQGSGTNKDVIAQVDPTHKALRASLRPIDVGSYGSYAIGLKSGNMAAGLAAGSVVYAFRWTATGILARISRVTFQAVANGTAFAAGVAQFDLVRVSSFGAQYTAGATLTLQGKDQVRASRFAGSQQQIANTAVGNIAIANTAALAAGSPAPVVDDNPLATLLGPVSTTAQTSITSPPGYYLVDPTEAARQPLELVNSEGFVIKATVPITGLWNFAVNVDWEEIDQQRYLGLLT